MNIYESATCTTQQPHRKNDSSRSSSWDDFHCQSKLNALHLEGIEIPESILNTKNDTAMFRIVSALEYVKFVWSKMHPDSDIPKELKSNASIFIAGEDGLIHTILKYTSFKENTKGFHAVKNILNGNAANYYDGYISAPKKTKPIQDSGTEMRLKDVRHYADNHKTIHIYYRSESGTTERDIDVYFIDGDLIRAYCHLRKEPRTFKRNRIIKWHATGDIFQVDANIARQIIEKNI